MKIALASDLHLEFADIDLKNTGKADVLVLSGDILIANDLHDHSEEGINTATQKGIQLNSRQHKAIMFRNFLQRCSREFPHVIYVAGNHEFYHGNFHGGLDDLRNECAKFPNVYFMENDTKVIGDTTFIGCTLWTDMNKGDPLTLHSITGMMSDYQYIREDKLGYTKLRPAHTMSRHHTSVNYIRKEIEGKSDGKFIVVGHMAPSFMSIHEDYLHDKIMNGAYASDLSELILDNPQIKLWTHGHVHNPFDYMIGDTRIVCNPRGYVGYEKGATDFELQYIDV